MKNYTVYDSSGNVVRYGTCLPQDFKAQAKVGETVVEGHLAPQPTEVITHYTYDRMTQYPAVGNQLDALFKLALALQTQGIKLPPDTVAWINQIQSVKDANPKGGA